MGTKLVELLLIGWLKKKYDNIYLREGACIESVRWSLIQGELLILSFSCLFFTILLGLPLLCLLLTLLLFLLLDDLLKLFLAFGLLVVLYVVLHSLFKLCDFYCQ
jgi:hypothetical protein